MSLADMIALISLAFNIIVAAVGLTWGVGKVRFAVRDEIDRHKDRVNGEVQSLRGETGEMGIAIRTKINDVELFVRDNFVRKDTFARFADSMSELIRQSLEKIDKRLDRMENKMDVNATTPHGGHK